MGIFTTGRSEFSWNTDDIYMILFGQQIEQAMGTFMFNLYIFGAWFWNTVIMLGISIYYYANGSILGMMDVGIWAMYYFDYGLFLAFALMYSDARVLFMFFIPIRAFWVAVIDMGLMAYEFMRPTTSTLNRGSIIAYLVNFFIFYLIMGRGVGMRSSNSKAAAKRRKRDYDRRCGESVPPGKWGGRPASQGTADGISIEHHEAQMCNLWKNGAGWR